MRYRLGLGLMAILYGCSAGPCELCGVWKSDEIATLESLRSCGWLTAERERTFGNGFFGRFVVEFEPNRSIGYFAEDGPGNALWGTYEVIERGDGYIVISEEDGLGEMVTRRLLIAGECLQTPMGDQGCYETLCRQ